MAGRPQRQVFFGRDRACPPCSPRIPVTARAFRIPRVGQLQHAAHVVLHPRAYWACSVARHDRTPGFPANGSSFENLRV